MHNPAGSPRSKRNARAQLTVAGLFAGIGGMELGFQAAGLRTELLCEIDSAAQQILSGSFKDVPLAPDVVKLKSLPTVDVVAGGFPCQNLSLVGMNAGIFGEQSGLIREVFRLVSKPRNSPRWLVLENVPFMLWHRGGHAIQHVTNALSELGFTWAYRVVDARAFGLPQRRRRVLIVASRTEDPRTVLFADDAGEFVREDDGALPCGFYWTEGRGGLGWAVDGVPTLKGGSALGIPSPPAIWFRAQKTVATPDIRDAERLQGFSADWTATALDSVPIRIGHRWKLVGNAVSVPVAEWLGSRLASPGAFDPALSPSQLNRSTWPNAAWGTKGKVFPVHISEYPRLAKYHGLEEFLLYPRKTLSLKASMGFLARARAGGLRFAPGFLDAVTAHIAIQSKLASHSSVKKSRRSAA
jgi:DNA (cytosine-5)-methyltransferase 1